MQWDVAAPWSGWAVPPTHPQSPHGGAGAFGASEEMSRVFQEKVRISGFSLCPGDQQLGPGTEQIWLPGIFQLEERSSLNLNLQPWEWGGTGQPLLWLGDHLSFASRCLSFPLRRQGRWWDNASAGEAWEPSSLQLPGRSVPVFSSPE